MDAKATIMDADAVLSGSSCCFASAETATTVSSAEITDVDATISLLSSSCCSAAMATMVSLVAVAASISQHAWDRAQRSVK